MSYVSLLFIFAAACATIFYFTFVTFGSSSLLTTSASHKDIARKRSYASAHHSKQVLQIFTLFILVGAFAVLPISYAEAQAAQFYAAQSTVSDKFNIPAGIAIDSAGNVYVTDYRNDRVLKETLSGGTYTQSIVVTLKGGSGPDGISVDANGNLYIASFGSNLILKETLSTGVYVESTIPTSKLNSPSTVIVDGSGALYIADSENNRVIKENPNGSSYSETVVASNLQWPAGLALDSSGSLYIGNFLGGTLVKETLSAYGQYTQSTIATTGLNHPCGIAVDVNGNIYIADPGNSRVVEEVLSSGNYTQITVPAKGLSGVDDVKLDVAGNIYIADAWGNNRVLVLRKDGLNFGSVPTASKSEISSLLFTFDDAMNLSAAPIVSTQGANGLDFAAASSGTCIAGHSYNAGDNCSVDLTFTPSLSGPRYGAAVLKDSSSNAIATGYAYGIGKGPQISFSPAVQSIVTSGGLFNPRGLTSDGNGNLYVADTDNNRVLKETFSGGTYSESTIASTGLLYPIGIAVDGAGNVYIGDCFHGRVLKEVPSSGSYLESTVVKDIGCPQAIVLDGSGDMYIAQGGGNILLETLSHAGYTQTTVISSGLSDADGIALDASGNIYIADDGKNQIIKETLSSGNYTASVIPTSKLNFPRQIAVDASGNIFIANANNGSILKETLTNGSYVESEISGGLNEADSVTVDAGGNVYIEDTYHRQVLKLDYADAPGLNFTATNVGATSSAQTVTLKNIGNAPLAFPVPSSGSNPAVSANFSVDDSVANACPQTSSSGSADASLVPGASCALAISFAPTTTGSLQGNIVIGDTNLNAANALQAIALEGTGSSASTNFVLSVPASAVYGNPVQVAAAITTGQTSSSTPSGTVVFSDQNGTFGSKAVTNGSATQSYLAPSVGSFTLNGAFSPSNPDYNKSSGQATIQITAAQLNLSANGLTRTYGAANPQLTGAITGAVNGDNFVEAFKTSATASSPVASYPIVPSASGPNLNNYTQNVQNGALQIAAAGLNITANDATRTYGAMNPQFTGTMAGLVNGDNLAETFTTTATNASPVATYTIVPSVSGAAVSNYNPTVKNGTLTVTAAGLNISANDATRTYGSVNPKFAGTVTGMVNGDQFTETFTTGATQNSPVAAYSIVPSASGPALSNYNPAIHNGTLTISPATLAVKANDATRTYGAANPAMTGTITGAVSGDSITATYITSATVSSPAATYPIIPNLVGQSLSNYTQSTTNGTLTVTAAGLTVKANDSVKTYGSANPQFFGSIAGAVNGDTFTETFTTTATSTSPVANYTIVPAAAGAGLSNYTQSVGDGTLTINPAALTVKANDNTRVYGTPNPKFAGTVSGSVNGDVFTETFTTMATQTSPVASYAIVPTAAGPNLANYHQTAVNGNFTITPATLTLSADSLTRVYGAANPALTGSFSGAVAGDMLQQSYSTTATPTSLVGSYSIVPAIAGASVSNYVQVVRSGTLTVTQAALHLTANDVTRPYGAQNPAFVGSITGLAAGDLVAEQFTTAAGATSFPGTYPIVPSATGSALANYLSTATNGTLTVTAVPLTATVQNVTRVYGAANPGFQGRVTGPVNHDSITETFTTSATAQSPVGSYAIKPVLTGANLAGYTPTLVEGTLTIVPAPLVATAANAGRMYGTANPVLWGSLSGVVNGDTLPATYSTTAQSTDTVGQYPIMASVNGTALNNYTLSVVPGVLAVQKASTFITLDPQKGVIAAGATIQLQAHVVSATTGVPSGTVRFYNGKHLLGEATLQNGTAVYSINPLPAGSSNTLTAVYQADANFLSSFSDVRSITLQGNGFTVKAMVPTMTVHAGDQAAFSLNVDPGTTGTYPDVVTFAVTGLPDGATATFSPATLAANSGNQTIAMTVQTKAQAASASGMARTDGSWTFPLAGGSALALVLLPLAGARRLRKAGMSMLLTLLLVLGGIAGSMALTGCGVTRNTAFPNSQPTTYVLTVTATSGGVQQTVTQSLTVQP